MKRNNKHLPCCELLTGSSSLKTSDAWRYQWKQTQYVFRRLSVRNSAERQILTAEHRVEVFKTMTESRDRDHPYPLGTTEQARHLTEAEFSIRNVSSKTSQWTMFKKPIIVWLFRWCFQGWSTPRLVAVDHRGFGEKCCLQGSGTGSENTVSLRRAVLLPNVPTG